MGYELREELRMVLNLYRELYLRWGDLFLKDQKLVDAKCRTLDHLICMKGPPAL